MNITGASPRKPRAFLQQRRPVDAGHDHVGDQQVDLAGVLLGQGQGLLAVGGLDHLVAAGAQQAGGDAAHGVLVLDEQDAADAGQVAGRRRGLGRGRGDRRQRAAGRGVDRQEDAEGRALPGVLARWIQPSACLTMP